MSKYDVNIKRLALLLLPTFWRKPLFGALIYAAVSPLQRLHTQFMEWKHSTDYRIQHNGQVCRLRAMLNDQFDPALRRITITDTAANMGVLQVYTREQGRSLLVPDRETGRALIVNRRGFAGVNTCDFWINIPAEYYGTMDEDRLKALVGIYKLASKRFSINYI